jgi:hypothetical protein
MTNFLIIPRCISKSSNPFSINVKYFSFQWNSSTTYGFEIERDFGTDYGICCWFTPQHNFTNIVQHMKDNHLHEPDWGKWFSGLKKARLNSKLWAQSEIV